MPRGRIMRCSNCLKNKIYIEMDLENQHHIRCNSCGMDIPYSSEDPMAQMILLQFDIDEARELGAIGYNEPLPSPNDINPYHKDRSKKDSLLAWEWENAFEKERLEQESNASSLSAGKIKESQEKEINDLTAELEEYRLGEIVIKQELWTLAQHRYIFGGPYRKWLDSFMKRHFL